MAVEALPEGSQVLQISDGRGYYCLPACIPDPDHYRWAEEVCALQSVDSITQWLADHGATHVLISLEDLDIERDQQNVTRKAIDRLTEYRELGCLRVVHVDDWTVIYEVMCGPNES